MRSAPPGDGHQPYDYLAHRSFDALGDMVALIPRRPVLNSPDGQGLTRSSAAAPWFPPTSPTASRRIVLTRTWLGAYFSGESADVSYLQLDLRGAALSGWTALRARRGTTAMVRSRTDRVGRRLTRRRRRQRRQPNRHHRPLSQGDWRIGSADGLRRWSRAKNLAHRSRAPLASRATAVAVLNC